MPSYALIGTGIIILFLGLVFSFIEIEINKFVGYRTKRSMASKEAWKYANKTSGKLFVLNGIIYMLVGWTTLGKPIGLILILNLIIIFVGLGLSIYYIEHQLAKKFGIGK